MRGRWGISAIYTRKINSHLLAYIRRELTEKRYILASSRLTQAEDVSSGWYKAA